MPEDKIKRKQPTLHEKLAACLIRLGYMDRDHAKILTAEQVVSIVQWDHFPVPFAIARDLDWTPEQYNHPTNLQPIGILAHREKSKGDKTMISKTDRISKAHEAFRSRILAKGDDSPKPVSKWPKGRKMQSRPFPKKRKAVG